MRFSVLAQSRRGLVVRVSRQLCAIIPISVSVRCPEIRCHPVNPLSSVAPETETADPPTDIYYSHSQSQSRLPAASPSMSRGAARPERGNMDSTAGRFGPDGPTATTASPGLAATAAGPDAEWQAPHPSTPSNKPKQPTNSNQEYRRGFGHSLKWLGIMLSGCHLNFQEHSFIWHTPYISEKWGDWVRAFVETHNVSQKRIM